MLFRYQSFLLLFGILLYRDSDAFIKNGEYRLHQHLFEDYDPEVRPIANDADIVNVTFDVALQQLIDVNTKDERFTISVFLRQYWVDTYLTWNPEDYGNVTSINVSPDMLWRPDIVLQNSVDEGDLKGNLDQLTKKIVVNYTGHIRWYSTAILTSKCEMDIQHFPFDKQVCDLQFVSWAFDGSQMAIRTLRGKADSQSYTKHSEWKIDSAGLQMEWEPYDCCETDFTVVYVKIHMRRKPLFHILHLILPMMIIAIMTVLSFYLPSETGERVTFGVTLLLAMTLFMMLLSEKIPAASDKLSKLGVFFNALFIEMMVMIVMMCYVARMYHKHIGDDPVPRWMKKLIFRNVSYKLGIRNAVNETRKNSYPRSHSIAPGDEDHGEDKAYDKPELKPSKKFRKQSTRGFLFSFYGPKESQRQQTLKELRRSPVDQGDHGLEMKSIDVVNKLMKSNNDVVLLNLREERKVKRFFYEWRICAMTIDRLCLHIFTLIFVLTAVIIFSRFE